MHNISIIHLSNEEYLGFFYFLALRSETNMDEQESWHSDIESFEENTKHA